MKKILLFIAMGLFSGITCHAQADSYLKKLTEGIIQLRSPKASNEALNNAVLDWSATGQPKITLMDDVRQDAENEFRGNGANKFKMNQVVTFVYSRQNTGMASKGDFFNSTEKDVFYSAIEKTVKQGCTATYTLTGHIGDQEFIFMSFNPKTKFTAKVNGKAATSIGEGVQHFALDKVKQDDVITFSIKNESAANESFVILNHNPQK